MISKKLLYLKLIINTLYWKNYFSYTETAESVFSTYGFFWAVTEITENFTPYTIKPFINSNWSLVLSIGIIVGFFISVYKTLPKTEAHYKFRNAEIFAGFMINDFFKIQGDKVISFNTDAHIKTHNENGFISEKSIQGQWRKAISIDLTNTETLVSKSINDEGYTLPMQVGSVITLKNDGVNYYLLTLTNLSQTGHVVNSNFTDIQNSLYSLWQYLHTKGNYGHIIIPLLGTGLARINKSRIDVAKEIIKSFSAAISQGKLCEKLTICISPDDYLKHQLDIDELNEYIQHICKFTNITTSSNGNGGNQLNT